MISFSPTDDQVAARDTMRAFAAQVMRPMARSCDEAAAIPDSFLAQAWELGLTATQIPEAFGGYGAPRSPTTNTIVLEELGHGDVSLALAAVAPSLFAYAVLDQGSEEQRRTYLPLFCGERYHTGALAWAESTPCFNPMRPATKAARRGETFVLNGDKSLVAMGDRASHFLVLAQSEDGVDAFVVPRDAAGLSISGPEKNLGLHAVSCVRLELRDVEVPGRERLGGSARADVGRLLDHARTALAAIMTGVNRAVVEYCVPYAKERVAFDEPIARKQSIAFRLSDMLIETESCRWLAWKAASDLEHGRDARRSAHQARSYAAEKTMWVTDNGVQILGGHGFIREHPVEMWYRNGRMLGVLEGTASV